MNDSAQVFFGETSPAAGRLYLRVPAGAAISSASVTGPRSRYARTLAARVPFHPLGDRSVWQAIVPDPCFWTPESPYLYDVEVQSVDASGQTRDSSLPTAFRPLAGAGTQLRLAGHNWVLRGARAASVSDRDISAWHEADLAMLAPEPTETLCREASEIGMLLLADLREIAELEAELARLARWPAVGVAFAANSPDIALSRESAPNLLIASPGLESDDCRGAHLTICDFASEFPTILGPEPRRPVIVSRPLAEPLSAAGARRACDDLQRDVAERLVERNISWRPAGYLV